MKPPKTASPLELSLKFLSFRPRSQSELERYLIRKKIPSQQIKTTVDHLIEVKLVDDVSFCEWWQKARDGSSPRSFRFITQELLQKGVSREVINQAIDSSFAKEVVRARKLMIKKTRKSASFFPQKINQTLARFGFSWDVIQEVNHSPS